MEIKRVFERDEQLISSLVTVWESSIRATHDFFSETNIREIKKYVFQAIEEIPILVVAVDNKETLAFMGIAEDKLEMLFITAQRRGQGIGRNLLELFVPLYLFTDIILITGIELVKHGEPLGSHYSIYVNSTWLTIMALFVGYYHYQSMRQTFLNQSIILEKNRMIEEKSAELDFIAYHDSLTGLQNRRYLANCLNNIYLESRDSQLKTGVFIIDIDDFKSYNDTFGHIKGDECLKRVSNALNLCLSEGFLIRYGGEEFVYLLKNTDLEEMQRIGTELCHTVERLHLLMPNTSSREYLTVSIGGAIGVLNGEESWQAVLEQADQALYKAKNTNKNKCICAVE